jgi:hypothetical protein
MDHQGVVTVTEYISGQQLRAMTKGSLRSHESLVEACRVFLSMAGIPTWTIYTGGIPKYIPGGQMVLRKNPHQIGFGDLIALVRDHEHPGGRVAFLEMKTGNARRHSVQLRSARKFETYGQLALVVRSVSDLEPLVRADRAIRGK